MSILDVLADKKLIKREDIPVIIKIARDSGNLFSALEKYNISERDLLEARGEYFGMPFRDLEDKDIPFDVLSYVPEESAKFYKIVPIGAENNVLEIGVVDPENAETQNALTFISSRISMPIKAYLIKHEDFDKVIHSYEGLSGEVSQALTEIEDELSTKKDKVKETEEFSKIKDGEIRIVEQAPVTKIVATIIYYATEGNDSDIHIEPMGEKVRVRFRVDGALSTSLVLPASVQDSLAARIKILSNLRLDEKRKPQDGRFSARIEGRKIDFRVSTLPAHYGEKVVIRILDPERTRLTLEST